MADGAQGGTGKDKRVPAEGGERPAPPVPSTVSPAAQAYLGSQIRRAHPFLLGPADANSLERWVGYVNEANAGMFERYKAYGNLPVSSRERDVSGVRTFILQPEGVAHPGVYVDFHGGGFALGYGEVCRLVGMAAAARTRLTTWSVDYRVPPLHPYPAGLDDAVTVFRAVLSEYDPSLVVVGGGAAGGGASGGNLAAAMLLRARDEGLPMPAGLMLFSPMVDMAETGDTFQTNLGNDGALQGSLRSRTQLYANGAGFDNPYLSPIHGEVAGFPPTMLITGTRDLLLSDTVRMHRKLVDAGVQAELHVWEAMSHGGFGGDTPEDLQVEAQIRRFISTILGGQAT